MITPRTLSLSFSAGAVAALVSSAAAWFVGEIGIADHFKVDMHPQLTTAWFFPNILWGAAFGLLFCLPILDKWTILRGLVIGLIPAAVELFVIYPIVQKQGVMGCQLGDLTPLFVLGLNALWGLVAAFWLKVSS